MTFLNEASGEYLFYIINFKVTSPVDLSVVELVSNVREKTSATIEVENPLTTPICLTVDCKCPDISAPSLHTVPGMSKVKHYTGHTQRALVWTHKHCLCVLSLIRVLSPSTTSPSVSARRPPGCLCFVVILVTFTTVFFSEHCLNHQRRRFNLARLWGAATVLLLSSSTSPTSKQNMLAR